jgi:hypothetical protein
MDAGQPVVQILACKARSGYIRGACLIDGKSKYFAFKAGHEYPDLDAEGRAVLTALAVKALLPE